MAQGRFTIELSEDFDTLSRRMRDYVVRVIVGPALNELIDEYRADHSIAEMVMNKIKSGRTWASLLGHAGRGKADLQAVLGLADPDSTLEEIERIILNSISIKKLRRVVPGIIVTTKDGAFDRLIDSDAASYISEPSGETIPWLKWLITGDGSVHGYHINFSIGKRGVFKSRSGRALMKKGGDWDIDPSIDAMGTSGSNFILEAFEDGELEQRIAAKFERDIGPALKRASNRANQGRRR